MFYDENIDCEDIAIWFLGQAGYFIKSGETTIMIDPYLTDSVGKRNPLYKRRYEFPINPADMYADIIILTHDHQDHLDDETINLYGVGKDTLYIAPHLTAKHLLNLGIKKEKVCVIDCGESKLIGDLVVTGMFALGTDYASIDTTGYHIKFKNGKSVYHTADTQWCDLLTMLWGCGKICSIGDDDSYFIAEIKSLKRILDKVSDTYCLCFIDEILKGTNTIERIAVSAAVLRYLHILQKFATQNQKQGCIKILIQPCFFF